MVEALTFLGSDDGTARRSTSRRFTKLSPPLAPKKAPRGNEGRKPMLRSYGRLFANILVFSRSVRATSTTANGLACISKSRKKALDDSGTKCDIASRTTKARRGSTRSIDSGRSEENVDSLGLDQKQAEAASDDNDLGESTVRRTRKSSVKNGDGKKDDNVHEVAQKRPKRSKISLTTDAGKGAKAPAVISRRSHRSVSKVTAIPARLLGSTSSKHHDLPTFLAYASAANLKATTSVYRGTLFEYTVASVLERYGFTLHRTGRSNDLGIDLVGWWKLPFVSKLERKRKKSDLNDALKVLIQCKAAAPKPSTVRELEGAYVGAPAGWRGEGVLAILVASREATKGVREALQRSQCPMALMQITAEGELKQFLWNPVAARMGLEGLGVRLLRQEGDDQGEGRLVLTWLGEILEAERRDEQND